MPTTIDISDPRLEPDDILKLARAGKEVVFSEGDKQLARLVPVDGPQSQGVERVPVETESLPQYLQVASQSQIRIAGLHRGSVTMSEDFDVPLPDSFWLGEE